MGGTNDHTREISPLVRPTTMTSLFAQSRDQHDVPSCSMRRAGSGNLTVQDQYFSLIAKKKCTPKTGEAISSPGGLMSSGSGTTYIESDPSSNVPAKMPIFRGFLGRAPSHFGGLFLVLIHESSVKTRMNLVMGGQGTPLDFLSWPAVQA